MFWIYRYQFKHADCMHARSLADNLSLEVCACRIDDGRGAFLCFGDLQSVSFQVLTGDTVLLGFRARVPT